jgi:hypothetical protein
MATPPTIHRHRIGGGSEAKLFNKFVDPPKEPGRTLDRVAPDVRISRSRYPTARRSCGCG